MLELINKISQNQFNTIISEAKDDLLLTDERYTKRAKDEAIDIKIEISRDFVSIIKREVARLNFAKIVTIFPMLRFVKFVPILLEIIR